MMRIMMMIMTDPFATNLVVKRPVVKGSVVKGATSMVMVMVMMMMMQVKVMVMNSIAPKPTWQFNRKILRIR